MRLSFAALILLTTLSAHAASDVPAAITARMEQDKKDCGEPVVFEKPFITRKDVNSDGVPDYILDYGSFVCGESHSYFCGSGGCTMAIYASSNGQYVKALDDLVQAMTFKSIKGRPAVVLDLHGSACGRVGSAPCRKTKYWNGSTFGAAR